RSTRVMTEENKSTSLELVAKNNIQSLEQKTQRNLLQVLDEVTSDYQDIQLDESEANSLNKQLKRMSVGSAAFTAMQCHGDSCPFASRCSLVQMRPSGHPTHGK